MNTILIVEDLPDTRRWLTEIAEAAFPGCKIDEAANMQAGIRAAANSSYDLALIDLGLPDGSGLEVLRNLKLVCPDTICVVTTILADDAHVVAALSAGAQGYLLKEQPNEVLSRQLTQISQGIPALSPSIARRIMEHFRLTGPAADPDEGLTTREREVLALIGRGLRNIDAAKNLEVSENTIASHIKSIYRKLGISSRAEASWYATQMGLAGASRPKVKD